MERAVLLVLRVHPDEGRGRDALRVEDGEDVHGRAAIAGVAMDSQSRLAMAEGSGLDQLAIDRGQRAGIDPGLDESRPDARPLDPVAPLRRPALGEPRCALFERMRGQVLVLGRAVVARIGDDVQPARFREAHQQHGVAAQPGGGAFDERARPPRLQGQQMREGDAESLVRVVTVAGNLGRAHEIDEHVLVDERGPEIRRVDRPPHRDRAAAPTRGQERPGDGQRGEAGQEQAAVRPHRPTLSPPARRPSSP